MDPKTEKILDLFQQINEIPRCSKNEEKIVLWLRQWAEEKQFPVKVDAAGNMVITVAPSAGYELSPVIVIQGHVDMVCEKSPDSDHDFSKDPIQLVYDGDWLRADGTTLGADNGIAIAMAMALAVDESVTHPQLELLFTVDEETGLNGAKLLEPGFVEGQVLLNVDSEAEGVFTVGCAGGRNTLVSRRLAFADLAEDSPCFSLKMIGLHGGHSGIDIHKQRANANKILARTLDQVAKSCRICLVSVKGGSAHNAIPRDAAAVFACDPSEAAMVTKIVRGFEKTVQTEYAAIEPSLAIALAPVDSGPKENTALSKQETRAVINLILSLPHGVMGMSPDFEGLVETSNNLAQVIVKDELLKIKCLTRSSVETGKNDLANSLTATFELAGYKVNKSGSYPGWKPNVNSPILEVLSNIYENLFKSKADVVACHAGLECGILGTNYPEMDMISFGPTIHGAHSPDERASISSAKK